MKRKPRPQDPSPMEQLQNDVKEIKTALIGKEFPRTVGLVERVTHIEKDVHTIMEERRTANVLREAAIAQRKKYKDMLLVTFKIMGAIGGVWATAYAIIVWFMSTVFN